MNRKILLFIIAIFLIAICIRCINPKNQEDIINKDYQNNKNDFNKSISLVQFTKFDIISASEDKAEEDILADYVENNIAINSSYEIYRTENVVKVVKSSEIKNIVDNLDYNIWPYGDIIEFIKNSTGLFTYEGLLFSKLSKDEMVRFLVGNSEEINVIKIYEIDDNWYYYKVRDPR